MSAQLFYERFGITVAGGQDRAKGKIIRIAHLGYYDRLDMIMVISALEMLLRDMGHPFELGAGVRAAEEILIGSSDPDRDSSSVAKG